jgi:hypothetical protein
MMVPQEKVASLRADLLRYDSRIKATEETLARLKELYRHIADVELPQAMNAADGSQSRMIDGPGITAGMDLHAGVGMAREARSL